MHVFVQERVMTGSGFLPDWLCPPSLDRSQFMRLPAEAPLPRPKAFVCFLTLSVGFAEDSWPLCPKQTKAL